jgi:hypothetical protein
VLWSEELDWTVGKLKKYEIRITRQARKKQRLVLMQELAEKFVAIHNNRKYSNIYTFIGR